MGRQTVLFKSEEKKNRNEAAVFLRQIADKVETGNLSLQLGNESVNLDFPQNLTLEIKAEEDTGRKTKRSLEIELEWIVGDHGQGSMVIG
ncbi:MAG: amphi-Trp domain-containing protein [Desulfobulbaceae bacterium]|nr:amphi-Trp domain-containing protein [Desulfobulbaceae bacterium]